MRFGIVRGRVVLSTGDPGLVGTRFLVVEPVTSDNLGRANGLGGGKQLIVADHLNPGVGELIAFVEGAEGANPYWPARVPVDAYCSLIVDRVDYHPPKKMEAEEDRAEAAD